MNPLFIVLAMNQPGINKSGKGSRQESTKRGQTKSGPGRQHFAGTTNKLFYKRPSNKMFA